MKQNNKLRLIVFSLLLLGDSGLDAIFPINYLRPYDELFYCVSEGENFQVYGVAEYGFKSEGRDCDGKKVEPFQLWQCDQSALAMLKGFSSDSSIGQFAQRFNIDNDDCVRGHLIPHACVQQVSAVVSGRWYLPYNLSLSTHLPVYSIEVSDVCWDDKTLDKTFEDKMVTQQLTNNLEQKTCDLGCLNICGWKQTGIGDLVIAGQWLKEFPQIKPLLRTVTLNFRTGMSFPTAQNKECQQDRAFAIPFGNDGAFGIFVGGGIDLKWEYHVRAGVDAEFLHLFGNTRERRIKTDPCQGDLLLLQKVKVWRDFGITQRFNLFLEWYRFLSGLSARATYQFWQHGEDRLSLFTNDYSAIAANSAQRLNDWTMHHFIFSLNYESEANLEQDARFKPQMTFYYKLPINGVQSILTHAIGGALVINF